MDLKLKKVLAKEIIILSCIILIILISLGGLKIANNKTDNKRQVLTKDKLSLEATLDSIIKLPWNLNWDKNKPEVEQVYNESNSPKADLEYSKRSSNDSITIVDITTKIELNEKTINNLSNFETNTILGQLSILLLSIVYPFRGLILLIMWAIKTIKD